ncbi:MAG: ROK family transcriptional regulator, partial [Porphyromonas sp.]|uniref:ROK family transcriptional regulator n=1 Tax=Porphyromonas sp. TaxID=1924944 RepID=UPI001CB61BA5
MTPKLLDDLSQETKKGLHKLRVINYLLRNKTATMTDIAKELYVSVPTASKILQDLQDGGCIQSQGKLEIGVGRFPLLFGLNPDGGYFIGVDIKRSGMHIGLINLQSELICADYDLPYMLENTPEALETICREIRGFITRHGIQPKEILNINVNLPGRINPVTGHSYSLFNFFGDRPLSEILSSKLALRVSIDNDTRGMAFGEFTAGCTKDMEVNSVLYVNISWGLGLGIIQDKQIYFGKSGFSGEFGHISVFDNQILCHCGKKGCLETEVSGQAMCRKIQERIRAGESSVLSSIVHSGRELRMSDLISACAQEDMLCLQVLS